jgi:hypothetical protein
VLHKIEVITNNKEKKIMKSMMDMVSMMKKAQAVQTHAKEVDHGSFIYN